MGTMADPIQLRVEAPEIIDQATPDRADDDFDAGVRGYPHAARFSDGTLYAHFYVSPWLNRQTRPVNCISLDDGRTWSPPRAMPIGPASEPLVLEDDTLLYFNELRVEEPHLIGGNRCETQDRGATFCEGRVGAVFQLPDEISIDLESPRSYWGQCEQFVYQYGFLREGETRLDPARRPLQRSLVPSHALPQRGRRPHFPLCLHDRRRHRPRPWWVHRADHGPA